MWTPCIPTGKHSGFVFVINIMDMHYRWTCRLSFSVCLCLSAKCAFPVSSVQSNGRVNTLWKISVLCYLVCFIPVHEQMFLQFTVLLSQLSTSHQRSNAGFFYTGFLTLCFQPR